MRKEMEPKLTLKAEDEEINIPINPAVATITANTHVHSAPAVIFDTATITWHDPINDKFKELEERIDKLQNKFEFVDVRKEGE